MLFWIEAHPGLAAWVQAIFSIIAIIAAWLGITHQITAAERLRELESSRTKSEMAAICSAACSDVVDAFNYLVLRLCDASREKKFSEISLDRFEALAQTITTLTRRELIPQLFGELIALQREIAYTLTAIRQHNSAKNPPTDGRIQNAEHREKLARDIFRTIVSIHKSYELIDVTKN